MKSKMRNNFFSILRDLFLLLLITVLLPVYLFLSLLIVLFSGWPVFYTQERTGLNGKKFRIYKYRTMIKGADKKQKILKKINEADGPVFKIRNDPRLTKIGKFLSHSGLDELPQLFNVLKGDMNLIGPRPLPVFEAEKIIKKYKFKREEIKPGILSPWVLNGYHSLPFKNWMESDLSYIKNKSFLYDLKVSCRSILFLIKLFFESVKESLGW
jgi:lipopolysaccharide/colanic/teichoic acid biosynthesis glycosyltransferase